MKRKYFAWTLAPLLIVVAAKAQVAPAYPNPEDGKVQKGAYDNPYFGLHYPLSAGWSEDLQGPVPSISAYYSLVSLKPDGALTATLLISAQDDFFAVPPVNSAVEFLKQMNDHLDSSLTATAPPAEMEIAGRKFAHFTYGGAALYHSLFATTVRCHTLIFSITSGDLDRIEEVAASLKKMTFSDVHAPSCVTDYATPDHLAQRVTPQMIGPRFGSVPVRIIIGPRGNVAHVHAIAGFPDQVKSTKEALAQWKFKPYEVKGKAEDVETGLLFQFPARE